MRKKIPTPSKEQESKREQNSVPNHEQSLFSKIIKITKDGNVNYLLAFALIVEEITKSMKDMSQSVIKAMNENNEKIINILTSSNINISNPMNNNNIIYGGLKRQEKKLGDKKGKYIDANEKESISLSNINGNNSSSNGNKNINSSQINSSDYSLPKRNTLKQNKNNFKEAQKTFYNHYTSSLNQKDQKKNTIRNNPFLPKQSTTSKKKKNYSFQGKKLNK